MEASRAIKELQSLAQLDVDAMHAYEQAAKHVKEPEIRARLMEFLGDHADHVEDLSREIRRLGGEPPTFARDVKGFLLEGVTAVMSLAGTRAALMAMVNNEILTNNRYRAALGEPWDAPLRGLITKNLRDEEKHLAYMRGTSRVASGKEAEGEARENPAPARQPAAPDDEGHAAPPGFGEGSLGLQS